jgi:hypothetical protein
MAYTHTSWIQAKTLLAARLQDALKVRYTDTEIGIYIAEAMRTWQILSSCWRERGTFNTDDSVVFYDLPTYLSTLRPRTITDADLVAQMQYHLLEPPTSYLWTGTEMFTLADLTSALEKRRNQFLVQTGCVLVNSTVTGISPPVGRVVLDDNVIDVRRLAWVDAEGVFLHLWREDEEVANSLSVGWNLNPAVPNSFSVAVTPPLQIQLFPPPLDAGTLDMISVKSGATLNPASGVLMGVPDDLAWVVKWGALADLLGKDGPAFDPIRAAYCEERWNFGVELAKLMPSVLQAYINDVSVPIESLVDIDSYYPNWQNETGIAQFVALLGPDLLAVVPVADALGGPYSVTLDVLKNAPIPATNGEYIQAGREELDAIIGYAEHLALWKNGAFELKSSLSGWQNLLKLAWVRNDRLSASTKLMRLMMSHASHEERARPRLEKHEEEEAKAANG